jgi:hypothetical protein
MQNLHRVYRALVMLLGGWVGNKKQKSAWMPRGEQKRY